MRKTFDDIIRRRWETQTFPVDEGHRQHMLELLEGKKKRKGFVFWWWGTGAAVVLAALFLLQQSSDNAQSQRTGSNTITTNPVSVHDQPTAAASNEMTSASASIETRTDQSTPGKRNSPINSIRTAKSQQESNDGKNDISNQFSNVLKVIKGENKNSPSSNSNSSRETNAPKQKQTTAPILAATTTTNEHVNEVRAMDENTVSETDPVTSESSNKVDDNVSPHQTVDNNEIAATHEVEPVHTQIMRPVLDIAWLDALPIELLSIDNRQSIGTIKPVNKTLHPLYAFAESGAGLILGSEPNYPAGWKLNAGAGIGYLLHPKWHLTLSGGYLMQNGGFDFERTSTVSSLGFGVRSQFNTLKPERLHHLYSRLGLQYRVHKHSFAGSLGVQWLYGAQGFITILTQDQFGPDSSIPEYAWLSTKGLNRWQYNAGLQYGYRLSPHLNIAAGAQFYFTSLTKSDPALTAEGYYWKGKTATVQPFITLNYLLYGPF